MANGTEITIQSEDVGTIIKGTAKSRSGNTDTIIDLNDTTAIVINLRDPDGNLTNHTATAVNADGGTDGIWKFTTASAIFSRNPGIWYIQAKYALAGGTIFYSNIKTLSVGEVLL
jgi:hypothetical protein|tara:strand:- start:6894 stop:7238 length:345 start_codon:yes stop_codon:yes gene_type:complete